ncbi:MAG: AI-2E family transporter [Chthoniobacteraceae bacterium]
MSTSEFPTPWQRKTLWSAAAALAVVLIGAIGVGLVWLISHVLGFLQPILIPFAVAGVLAYLFDPVVGRIQRWGTSRRRAVAAVFAVVTLGFIGIALWIVPAISSQTGRLIRRVPVYAERVKTLTLEFAHQVQERTGFEIFPELPPSPEPPKDLPRQLKEVPPPGAPVEPIEKVEPGPLIAIPPVEIAKVASADMDWQQFVSGKWVQTTLPALLAKLWHFITSSVGGFLGVFGFLLSMVIVPVYLWYLLVESPKIATSWGDYVPLTKSAFKDEVVGTIGEINGYLIAFFRGQLLVSLVNGTATGIGLMIIGLDFGLLIGLLLCVMGLIPYLGIALCWIPAVIIASVQQGGTWLPTDHWWVFPLVVSGIFAIVQQLDALFLTPKIVGESVGLHPMTVIFSVFSWSLLMGGLLGAILAVPMTATLKVLLRRYIWEKRILAEQRSASGEGGTSPPAEEPGQVIVTP